MSQRNSGYERSVRDTYLTPTWVTQALVPHVRTPAQVWEPACGPGKIIQALSEKWPEVPIVGTDLDYGRDFLMERELPFDVDAIITNPPYNLAQEFVEHAVRLMEGRGGYVAMLMRTDWDHAKTRAHLFRDCPAFAKKVVLTKRVVWFEPEPGERGKSPSFNHSWWIWDWRHEGPPTIAYGP